MNTFNVGDFITINRWLSHQDHSWVGQPLQVLAVDQPFLVVKESHPNARPFSLDTRRCEVRGLSEDFVQALIPNEAWPSLLMDRDEMVG